MVSVSVRRLLLLLVLNLGSHGYTDQKTTLPHYRGFQVGMDKEGYGGEQQSKFTQKFSYGAVLVRPKQGFRSI